MIDTQPMLSQFHLANGSTGTTNGHHYLSNRKQHVHHKHSQSLDANGPFASQYNADYIAISECSSGSGHSGKSLMHKQLQQQQIKSTLTSQQMNTCQDRLANHLQASSTNLLSSISQLSIFDNNAIGKQQVNRPNCESSSSRIVLHARSSSNIVLGSKKQYEQQFNHLNNLSTICSPANAKICLLTDKSTNRHFKVYEKNELANSTSLIDVSLANCLGTTNCNCNKTFLLKDMKNLNSLNHYFPPQSNYSSHHSNQTQFLKSNSNSQSNYIQRSMNKHTCPLNDKFDCLSLNGNSSNFVNQLNNLNYVNKSSNSNATTHHQIVPPRPPKPINLRISNQINTQSDHLNSTLITTNLPNNNSFNESFSNSSFIMPSDEEYSPTTSSKLYGSYYQFQNTNQSQHQRLPKNSLSSSCSSNASPFCNSNNTQDSVFVYDQNQLNMSNFQAFNHSSSNRLIGSEDVECSIDKSPTYLNNFSLNSQSSPKLANTTYNLPVPPAVDRGLKPRKVLNSTINESKLNDPSSINNSNSNLCNQTNVLISGGLMSNDAEDEWYNTNYPEDHLKSMNEASNGYLDLDFASTQDEDENLCSQQSSFKESSKQPLNSNNSSSIEIKDTHTVYKTVDFVRTKAFNKLRTNFERHD